MQIWIKLTFFISLKHKKCNGKLFHIKTINAVGNDIIIWLETIPISVQYLFVHFSAHWRTCDETLNYINEPEPSELSLTKQI